jgi:hypothetical protein
MGPPGLSSPPAGTEVLEVRPTPIPDLFCGMPLLVTGSFTGAWVAGGSISGNLPSGECRLPAQPPWHVCRLPACPAPGMCVRAKDTPQGA